MRRTRVLTVGIVVLGTMTAACGAGPSVRPDVAVVQEADGRATPTGEDPALAPELPVPARDLDWRDCTADTLAAQQLPPGPTGLVLECAQLPAAIDATGTVPGSFPLDVLRARLAQTPTDAAPLVMTTGADMPSSGGAGRTVDRLARRTRGLPADRRGGSARPRRLPADRVHLRSGPARPGRPRTVRPHRRRSGAGRRTRAAGHHRMHRLPAAAGTAVRRRPRRRRSRAAANHVGRRSDRRARHRQRRHGRPRLRVEVPDHPRPPRPRLPPPPRRPTPNCWPRAGCAARSRRSTRSPASASRWRARWGRTRGPRSRTCTPAPRPALLHRSRRTPCSPR